VMKGNRGRYADSNGVPAKQCVVFRRGGKRGLQDGAAGFVRSR